MMSDPERLLESRTVDPEVRELLQSLRNVSPEPGTGAKSWAVMSAKIAALPVLATASKSAAQTVGAASKAVALKVAAGALATAVVGTGVFFLQSEHSSPPPPAKPVPAVAAPVEQSVAPAEPPQVPAIQSEKTSNPPAPGSAATRRSQLDAEASLLSKARSELRSGNTRGAEAALNQLQSAFPRGQLGQEREVLAVEVLAANGNLTAARRRARAFIAAHPTSPHSAKLERLVGER